MFFFKPKRYKLICPSVCLHKENLCRIHKTKYLGYFLSEDHSDDAEVSKQIRTLYMYNQTRYCECLVIAYI